MGAPSARVDLLIANARHVATLDADRREVADGWVAIDGGRIAGKNRSHHCLHVHRLVQWVP